MSTISGDLVVFGECRLKNLRTFDVKKNGEVVGSRTTLSILTWGGEYQADVDPSYAKELSFGVTGRAVCTADFDSDKELKKFDGDAYQKTLYKVSDLVLKSFEPGK